MPRLEYPPSPLRSRGASWPQPIFLFFFFFFFLFQQTPLHRLFLHYGMGCLIIKGGVYSYLSSIGLPSALLVPRFNKNCYHACLTVFSRGIWSGKCLFLFPHDPPPLVTPPTTPLTLKVSCILSDVVRSLSLTDTHLLPSPRAGPRLPSN